MQSESPYTTYITLLIFDECHNARKSNPYAVIMERYLKVKVGAIGKIPQVIGLTASPGAGDNPSGDNPSGDADAEKSLEHLQFCVLCWMPYIGEIR